jgi:hypothetical protein
MGNETLRASRSSTFRRSSRSRRSQKSNSNGGQMYIAEDEMDRTVGGTAGVVATVSGATTELATNTPKPVVRRMDKIRRS